MRIYYLKHNVQIFKFCSFKLIIFCSFQVSILNYCVLLFGNVTEILKKAYESSIFWQKNKSLKIFLIITLLLKKRSREESVENSTFNKQPEIAIIDRSRNLQSSVKSGST